MMDLKELIKWLILCFHVVTMKKRKMDSVLTFLCLFLFFKSCVGMVAKDFRYRVPRGSFDNNIGFNLDRNSVENSLNQSIIISNNNLKHSENTERSFDTSVGRTFGGPRVKKLMFAMLPVIFQLGAASTWAVISALVGIKTLAVTMLILKFMLLAAAVKFGAFFASKLHPPAHGWEPTPSPHKEIHLHIHNGQLGQEVHQDEHTAYGPWSRQGSLSPLPVSSGGPQTISTPFGHYVKVDSPAAPS